MAGPGGPRTGGPSRHDVHPAMRMAQQQAAETQSSGRGSFTWMLPLYTVGVVIFLLYTLFKTKGKKKRRYSLWFLQTRAQMTTTCTTADSKRKSVRYSKRKLRSLQERLQQTEEAMSKILEQLEAVQAAGALAEGELSCQSKVKDGEKPEAAVEVNSKNEQYINDLEKALRDFKEKRTKKSEEDDSGASEEESPKENQSKQKVDLAEEETAPVESSIESKETTKSAKQLRRRPKKD
ncbi:hypothetical protein OSTOST_02146, partial [Ostertagia ostertagi]